MESLESRTVLSTYTFNLTFESPLTGSEDRVLSDFGSQFVVDPAVSGLELIGHHASGVADADLTNAGFGGNVLSNVESRSEEGTGRIEIHGALGKSISFHYGQKPQPSGFVPPGSTFYTYTATLAGSPSVYSHPRLFTSKNPHEEDIHKQFALGDGADIGPESLDGPLYDIQGNPIAGEGYFNSFRWTSGTSVGDVFSQNRPGSIQLDGEFLAVESGSE